ncbi:hypothetical protein [Aliiroseovarius sp. xm-m-309]|uniref:hypothetical protein n=1 Tax=Aliiroseovarius sp. xm-m-309 TaxID=2651827 RepID=UPI0015689343|nr:hypothetical protein [Aliiroseovarius sp. xm-m-309]
MFFECLFCCAVLFWTFGFVGVGPGFEVWGDFVLWEAGVLCCGAGGVGVGVLSKELISFDVCSFFDFL